MGKAIISASTIQYLNVTGTGWFDPISATLYNYSPQSMSEEYPNSFSEFIVTDTIPDGTTLYLESDWDGGASTSATVANGVARFSLGLFFMDDEYFDLYVNGNTTDASVLIDRTISISMEIEPYNPGYTAELSKDPDETGMLTVTLSTTGDATATGCKIYRVPGNETSDTTGLIAATVATSGECMSEFTIDISSEDAEGWAPDKFYYAIAEWLDPDGRSYKYRTNFIKVGTNQDVVETGIVNGDNISDSGGFFTDPIQEGTVCFIDDISTSADLTITSSTPIFAKPVSDSGLDFTISATEDDMGSVSPVSIHLGAGAYEVDDHSTVFSWTETPDYAINYRIYKLELQDASGGEPSTKAPSINFTNTTLKSLWQRLVLATDKICGVSSSSSWQIILTSGEKDSSCYPYVEGNMLYSNGDPWEMEEVSNGTTWSFAPGEPLDISGFDTSGDYHIYSPGGGWGDYRLVYQFDTSSTRSIGIKPIHDALLNHFGISHDNTPTTPGDYMTGIAVAARYHSNGHIIDTESKNSLEEIVTMLESGSVTKICSHCDIAFDSNESFITRSAIDGPYYYHMSCAKEVQTIDPTCTCMSCGTTLNVYEEYMYNSVCGNCYSEPNTYTYYNAQYHKTSSGELEEHYDHSAPTCICGADPCSDCGGYYMSGHECGGAECNHEYIWQQNIGSLTHNYHCINCGNDDIADQPCEAQSDGYCICGRLMGYSCDYPGCDNVGDWPSTDWDGIDRYYCCDEHYNNYCYEHGIYYGRGDCPDCGGSSGPICDYPGCSNSCSESDCTDWGGVGIRYYCCPEHYNQYCNTHGIYYGPEGTACPSCNGGGEVTTDPISVSLDTNYTAGYISDIDDQWVWYTFTPIMSTTYAITGTDNGDADMRIWAYKPESLNNIEEALYTNSDSDGFTDFTIDLDAGTTYWICVKQYSQEYSDTWSIAIAGNGGGSDDTEYFCPTCNGPHSTQAQADACCQCEACGRNPCECDGDECPSCHHNTVVDEYPILRCTYCDWSTTYGA